MKVVAAVQARERGRVEQTPRTHRWHALAIAGAGLAALVLAGCGHLDRDDLHSSVGEVHTYAAEGMLLAREDRLHRIPVEFVWYHAQELRHRVVEIEDGLQGEIVTAGVSRTAPEAANLAQSTAQALSLLHREPNSQNAAISVQITLARDAAQTKVLEDKLQ